MYMDGSVASGRRDRSMKAQAYPPRRDHVEVRIRGKNNELITKTGSVSRTLGEIDIEKKRKAELKAATYRLKMLEKLEDYREEKMQ